MIRDVNMAGLLVFLSVLALFLTIAYALFYTVFQRNRHTLGEESMLPGGKQYEPYAESILRRVKSILSIRYELVSTLSWDGLRLYGKYYHTEDGAPLVIFFHGYRSNSIRDGNGAFVLSKERGYNVLMVDQRAHGKSEGRVMTFGLKERFDCLQWIFYARERFGKDIPILLMGLSMGAATVLMATGEELPENVRCVIADCPFSSPREIIQSVMKKRGYPVGIFYPIARFAAAVFGGFELEETTALEAVKKSRVPILVIHGEDDHFVPCDMGKACFEACLSQKQLFTVKGAGHGLCYCVDEQGYMENVNCFLDKIMGR